jgi:hypothetical protein
MKKQSTNRLGSRRGNAMIEFALASLILIPLFFGAFQFGYTFYVYNLLCTQIRAASRYGSVRTFNAGNSSSITAFKTAVKNVVLTGDPSGSGTVIAPGLAAHEHRRTDHRRGWQPRERHQYSGQCESHDRHRR